MKMLRVIFVSVCLVGLTQLLWSQNASVDMARHTQSHGVPGYLDPRTGIFTTRAQAAPAEGAQEPTVTAVPFEVKVDGVWHLSTIPKAGDIVSCQASLSVFDAANSYFENAASIATISGANATCNVLLPVEWTLATPNTDTFSVSYRISIVRAIAVGSTTNVVDIRDVDVTLPSQAVPSSGAIITINIPTPRI
jgi:hypothetical protein